MRNRWLFVAVLACVFTASCGTFEKVADEAARTEKVTITYSDGTVKEIVPEPSQPVDPLNTAVGGAVDVATGVATGNGVAVVTGIAALVSAAGAYLFGTRHERKKHE